MKLISKKLHEKLLAAAEKAKPKYEDNLMKAKAPVSVRLLSELGVSVSAEAKAAQAQVESQPLPRGASADAVTNVLWADYYKALKAYKPDEPKQENAPAK